jgi:hypothetical protein
LLARRAGEWCRTSGPALRLAPGRFGHLVKVFASPIESDFLPLPPAHGGASTAPNLPFRQAMTRARTWFLAGPWSSCAGRLAILTSGVDCGLPTWNGVGGVE